MYKKILVVCFFMSAAVFLRGASDTSNNQSNTSVNVIVDSTIVPVVESAIETAGTSANASADIAEAGVESGKKILKPVATGVMESGKIAATGISLASEGTFKVIKGVTISAVSPIRGFSNLIEKLEKEEDIEKYGLKSGDNVEAFETEVGILLYKDGKPITLMTNENNGNVLTRIKR